MSIYQHDILIKLNPYEFWKHLSEVRDQRNSQFFHISEAFLGVGQQAASNVQLRRRPPDVVSFFDAYILQPLLHQEDKKLKMDLIGPRDDLTKAPEVPLLHAVLLESLQAPQHAVLLESLQAPQHAVSHPDSFEKALTLSRGAEVQALALFDKALTISKKAQAVLEALQLQNKRKDKAPRAAPAPEITWSSVAALKPGCQGFSTQALAPTRLVGCVDFTAEIPSRQCLNLLEAEYKRRARKISQGHSLSKHGEEIRRVLQLKIMNADVLMKVTFNALKNHTYKSEHSVCNTQFFGCVRIIVILNPSKRSSDYEHGTVYSIDASAIAKKIERLASECQCGKK
jgi:hypothetical protein